MLNNETIYELTQGIEFMGYEHMIFYCENVIKTKSERDVYRKAFFYTLGILVTTRTNIDSLYDFQSNCPKLDAPALASQSAGITGVSHRARPLSTFCCCLIKLILFANSY